MTQRLKPSDRTRELIAVAMTVTLRTGWAGLTHDAIAQAGGVSRGLVVARLGAMPALRRSVMRCAVKTRLVPIVAEGLAAGDRYAKAADPELRAAAAEYVRTA